ncbi:MAG: hypothetical protein ACR2K3_08320, partial [Nocardioides sp.]
PPDFTGSMFVREVLRSVAATQGLGEVPLLYSARAADKLTPALWARLKNLAPALWRGVRPTRATPRRSTRSTPPARST